MAIEDSGQPSHNILGWLEDSASFIPSGFDEPHFLDEFNSSYHWWDWDQTPEPTENLNKDIADANQPDEECVVITPQLQPPPDQPRKRNGKMEEATAEKRSARKRKSASKCTGNSSSNGNKDGRWAEQLLNPCATAIVAGNFSQVQHYIYVLRELASYTGDSNRRLAAYGLRALIHHLSSSSSLPKPFFSFASAEPKILQQSLLRFYEVSPLFAFPNSVANSAILQILAQEGNSRSCLHILDIGVSHGMQWPTLLEALARRPEGPPPKVHITIISTNISNDPNAEAPFSVGPPTHSYSSQLHSFARSLNINLQISELDNYPLQDLSTQIIKASAQEETLVVCAQFRLHQLNHNSPDERTCFLKRVRRLEPRGVVLSDNNTDCSCSSCGDFAMGFSKQLDYLWKFLDSTSCGFKGQECEERNILEGEAAKALMSKGEMNERKDKWYTRMRRAGFDSEAIAEEAIDRARSLLKKYDNNWEMRVEDEYTSIELLWKGESVSFCSLWKVDNN